MERYEDEGAEDSDNETNPEQLLNEWLGELDNLTLVSRKRFVHDSRPNQREWKPVTKTPRGII